MKTLVEDEDVCFFCRSFTVSMQGCVNFSLAVDKSHDHCAAHEFTFLLPEI
jgi:hypothetical protein